MNKTKQVYFGQGEICSLIGHLGPTELLLGPLKPLFVPLSFLFHRKRVSMIITVSKMLWIKSKLFIRANSRPLNSFLDHLNLLKGLRSVIYNFLLELDTLQFIQFQTCLKHQWNEKKTPMWQCNVWFPTSNIEVVRQPRPRNLHKVAIISYQVPGEQRITKDYRGLLARPVVEQGWKKS